MLLILNPFYLCGPRDKHHFLGQRVQNVNFDCFQEARRYQESRPIRHYDVILDKIEEEDWQPIYK